VGNDEALMDHCRSFHNCGRPYGSIKATSGYPIIGTNRRMTEYQAAILLNQIQRLEADTVTRVDNANYLTSRIKDIPGIVPHKLYEGATRAVYHLYPFRYKKAARRPATEPIPGRHSAEGIPCSGRCGPPVPRRRSRRP
jgi:dTDP-4-amino-4,6-dideoxygalactose transaminase